MRKYLFFILTMLFFLLTTSCGSIKYIDRPYPVNVHTVDSLYFTDTIVDYKIEYQKVSAITDGKKSRLENRFCVSEASWDGDSLRHSLTTKIDNSLAIPIKMPTFYHKEEIPKLMVDTIVQKVPRDLSFWQQFLIKCGYAFLFCLLGFGVYLFLRIKKL